MLPKIVSSTQNRNFWVWVSVSPSCVIWPLATFLVPPSCVYRSHRDSKVHTFSASRYHRVCSFVCNGWILAAAYIYPFTHLSFVGEALRTHPSFTDLFFGGEPPTHVLRPRYSNPIIWILISSLPKLLSTKSTSPTHAYSVWEWFVSRRLSLEAQEQGVHWSTPSITFWRVVPPRFVRWRLGASYFVLWSWTKMFVRARRSPTSWRSIVSEASPVWTEVTLE